MTVLKEFTSEDEREQILLRYGLQLFGEKVAPRLQDKHDGWHVMLDLLSGTSILSTRLQIGVRRLKLRAPC